MRIIHFSDFHLQGGKILILHKINAEKLLDALRKVNKQKEIDLVVFGGDLIDRGGNHLAPQQKVSKLLKKLFCYLSRVNSVLLTNILSLFQEITTKMFPC